MKTFYQSIALSILLCSMLASCGGAKSHQSQEEESDVLAKEYSPMDLYFMIPTEMLVSPGGGSNRTAYLPDFINYPNDLVKLGLRGRVKECEVGVSTLKFIYKFNIQGNLTNYQFRMDSKGYFGEGAKLEYDAAGHLTFLGRDFKGQSPNSHRYVYEDDVLVRREYGSGFRLYEWVEDGDGRKIPSKVTTKGWDSTMGMKYARDENGNVVLTEMVYDNPRLPGSLTAESGMSTFRHSSDGRLSKVLTAYKGCSDRNYPNMWGECEYTYNPQGDVEKLVMALYDSKGADRQQLYTVTQTYTYTYDSNGNWVSVSMNSTNPDPGVLRLSDFTRTISYYTEEEINAFEEEKREMDEKPFVGQWRYSSTTEHATEYGEIETIEDNCTIILNLYDKFVPDGYDEHKYGIMFVESLPSLGMEQYGSWDITEVKVVGDRVDIRLKGLNSGDEYTAKLLYNPKDKSLSLTNFRRSKSDSEKESDSASDFEEYDLEPFEGSYKFLKRSTSNNE